MSDCAEAMPFTAAPAIPGASLEAIERYAIEATLAACDGSTSRAAKVLGISVRTIQYKKQRWALEDNALEIKRKLDAKRRPDGSLPDITDPVWKDP